MSKKERSLKVQAGNFLLKQERNKRGNFLSCMALSGQWSVRWGEGCLIYGVVMKMIIENDVENLQALLFLIFATTSYVHSTDFYLGLNKIIMDELNKIPTGDKPTQKEEGDALRDVQEIMEIQELSESLEKEDGA